MKGIYIARIDEKYSLDYGVANKINGQLKAFKFWGWNMDYIRLSNKTVKYNTKFYDSVKIRYFAFNKFYKILKNSSFDYKVAYIRYAKGDWSFYKTLKLFKKRKIPIIVEIPTYPYRNEVKYNNPRAVITGILDWFITRRMRNYVTFISTTSYHKEIFGIKTININNGIDLDSFLIVDRIKEEKQNVINLIGIANIARWHGYDRLIKGLANYYNRNNNKIKVHFYIVGEGNEKANLIKLTKDLGVEDYIHFMGAKTGKDLDDIFSHMDIGVSSLALFRAGGGHDPIKSKEFIGRGLPVILGYKDSLINMQLPYVHHIREDESDVDIMEIINFYTKSKSYTKSEIREYAKLNLSWESQMKKILNQFEMK